MQLAQPQPHGLPTLSREEGHPDARGRTLQPCNKTPVAAKLLQLAMIVC